MARGKQLSLPNGDSSRGGGGSRVEDAALATETQRRYLNYALSVITSRALPDVRDGLKPVQRRIVYTMNNSHLTADAKPKKSAAIVGDVLGKYHPHGDSSVYDAMVRLAQTWAMRAPLVFGQGNFGSVDGDAPAAMRYTEARLTALASELIAELGKRTVEWRPNYDGSLSEPVVLPARFPNLLVNGAQGIAVGMATSIPPHNLGEVIDACLALVDDPNLTTFRLLTHIKGPDFPTGGLLQATKKEIEAVYEGGHGSFKLRGEWTTEDDDKKASSKIIVTSIPYALERGTIVEKIAQVIIQKKLPALLDVRDESTDVIRIVLEIKKGTDPNLVMAYLFKNTPLATSVQVNMTVLVPTSKDGSGESCTPRRIGLKEMLQQFLKFRMTTLKRRLEFDLQAIKARIHILEGFEIVFDALDEIIKIIRASEGRADAQAKLMKRFKLSEEQTDAILELRLYRLAKLEILIVRKELDEKRAEAKKLEGLIKSDAKRWSLVKDELAEIKKTFADKRRTKITVESEPEFQEEDFIVAEDATVLLSAQGWVKRVREVKDLATTRVREGDHVLAATLGSTRSSVAFFSNQGVCYVSRIVDVPASTGYGDPVQKLFKLADGERMVNMLGFDPRILEVTPAGSGEPEPPFAVAVTRQGLGFRFALGQHAEPSTRAGRKFARLNPGDEVIAVFPALHDDDVILCAASDGHALGVPVAELALLSGAGKGSMVMKVANDAALVGAALAEEGQGELVVVTDKGKEMTLKADRILGSRAQKGTAIVKRDHFVSAVAFLPDLPKLEEEEEAPRSR